MEKYRHLVIAQIAGLAAVLALFLAYSRYAQVHSFYEPTFLSFVGFGVVLFAVEIRSLLRWLKDQKARKQSGR